MKEKWKPIWGYTGKYEVSTEGNVRRTKKYKNGSTKIFPVKQYPNNHGGYMRVSLYKNGESKKVLVHRLVAKAFIKNIQKRPLEVDHIDGNVSNNNVNNLQWVSHKKNCRLAASRRKKIAGKVK